MAHINQSLENFEAYTIRSCTNTGVWVVEQQSPQSNTLVATYDFVNKEYAGPETGGAPIAFDALGGEQERQIMALQKQLNKALLD